MNTNSNVYVAYFADIYGEVYGKYGELYEISSRLINYFEMDFKNDFYDSSALHKKDISLILSDNLKSDLFKKFNIHDINNFRIISPYLATVELSEYENFLSHCSINFEFIVHFRAFTHKDRYLKCIEEILNLPNTMECSNDNKEIDKCKKCPYYFYFCKQSKLYDYQWDDKIKISAKCAGLLELEKDAANIHKRLIDLKITA